VKVPGRYEHPKKQRNDNAEQERSKKMFERILVPLDVSRRAEQALPIAARLARASRGTDVLLRVVSLPNALVSYLALEPIPIEVDIDAAREEARNYLDHIATGRRLVGIHTEAEVILGQAAVTILSAVNTHHLDLIVLCSHGYTGMMRWFMGSVAEKVAHHSLVPVLVLREGGPLPVGPHPDAESPWYVLVPLDGSARAQAAVTPAAQLSAALSAPARGALHLTRVVVRPDPGEISHRTREAIMHEAKEYLGTAVEQIRDGLVAGPVADLQLAITWSVTLDEDIASGIIRVAEGGEDAEGAGVFGRCQVIAMTTHGSGGLPRWVILPITQRVLHATRLPLLIVRPPDMMDKAHGT
jgi:nucleotide-binding universal stress UspA family protein